MKKIIIIIINELENGEFTLGKGGYGSPKGNVAGNSQSSLKI